MPVHNQFSCFLIGEGTLPIQCAEFLLKRGHQIFGIISQGNAISDWAKGKDIPHIQTPDSLIAFLSQKPFDYLFSIVNSSVLSKEILELPRQCAINYHDAPLPRYAGVYATSWALMHQEKIHGVTWHVMSNRVDEGDILKQFLIDVADDETAFTLNGKCYEAAIDSFAVLIEELEGGKVLATKQNLEERTYFGRAKRPSAGGVLSWNRCAPELDALVRGLDFGPYTNPLALPKLAFGSDLIIVSKLEVQGALSESPPGTVTAIEQNFLKVSTTSYEVALHQVLTLNGQRLSTADLVARFGLEVGYRFKNVDPDIARRIEAEDALIAKHEAFWVERLATLEPITIPYTERTASHSKQKRYANVLMPYPHEVITFLERHPAWNQSEFLLAAFAAYLARIGGTYCFDIGFRDVSLQRELVGLEGFFASIVPCRLHLGDEQSFEEVFEAVRQQVELTKLHFTYARDAVARYPALRSVPELLSENMFGVIIERVERLDDHKASLGNELTLVIPSDGQECCWFYDAEALDSDSIARMLRSFATFLQGIVTDTAQRIAYLTLLSQEECDKILVEWNSTQTEYPQDLCIHQLFEAQVERTPDAVAVVFEAQQLTYRELNRRANQLAHYLLTLGVGPDVLVGICVERSLEMVVGLLGILKAGGAYVPLDPEYSKSRLAFMLHDTQAPILLTQKRLHECLPQSVAKVVCLDTDWKQISLLCDRNPANVAKPMNLAYVIYTSGSTGQPKGVMIPHRSICNHLLWMQTAFQLTEVDRVLQKTSLSFDVSTFELFWPLLAGLRVIIAKPGGHQDTAYLVKLIAQQKITFLHAVPSLLQVLLESEELETCNCLRYVTCGAEALPNELKERFFARLDVQLYNAYGPTEAAVGVIYAQCQRGSNQPIVPIGRPIANTQIYLLDSHQKPQPIGVPGELHIGGVGLARGYLNRLELTAERFIPNPFSSDPGAILYKTGDNARYLADGNIEYLGRIDHQVKIRGFRIELGEIEAVLSQHPAVLQTVVIAREDVPGDKRLVAYVVPNQEPAPTVNGDWRGVPPLSQTGVDLRRFLKEQLPVYMIPNAFVMLDTLPLTPNGKVDRRLLPVPDTSDKSLEAGFVPPRTPTEEVLAGIWAEVLRVEVGIHDNFFELGGHSLLATQVISRVRQTFNVELPLRTLFEAPTVADLGSSLETVRSATPEWQATKETLTPRQAEILTFVHNARETEAGTYQSPWWGKDNEYPISPELELYWVASQLTSGNNFSPKFSLQNRSIWECEFDPVLFQRACDLVVERNEILRTRLIRKGSWVLQLLSGLLPTPSINTGSLSRLKRLEQATIALLQKPHSVRARLLHRFISLKIQLSLALVRQKVLPPQPVQWTNHNCEPVSDHMALQRLVEEIAHTEAECPFDLEMGPLFRSCVIKNWNNTHTVIVTVHHGFVDFIGIQQVMDELRTVYQALLRNELDSLAVRPQYRNYATRLASLKNSSSYKADLEFWQKHFANCNPTVVPPQPSTYHREDFYINEPVDQETAALIHSYCQQKRQPASAFFLAGYYLFLYRITRQSHLYTLVNNGVRPDLESEATIGMFLQLFPLVVNLTQTPTIADLIQASAQNIFALLDHRRVSLPCLVSHDIRIAAAMMKQPVCLFQVIQTTHKPKGHRRVPRYGIDASEWLFTIGINVPSQYHVNVAYNTAFYKHEYVENLVDEYQQILAIMATNPQGSVLGKLTPGAGNVKVVY